MALVVAFLLVDVFPSSWHSHHAAVSLELALHQFVGIAAVIVIGDRCGRETVANVVYGLELVLIDAKLLVNATSPRHRSHPATRCGIRALHQILVTVMKIGRHVLLLQMRSKLTPEITILKRLTWHRWQWYRITRAFTSTHAARADVPVSSPSILGESTSTIRAVDSPTVRTAPKPFSPDPGNRSSTAR